MRLSVKSSVTQTLRKYFATITNYKLLLLRFFYVVLFNYMRKKEKKMYLLR